ncbi:hypothetical protein ACJJIK_02345 [Microbulbifer sp. ZKSA006]|uniref:hypothetical protein n=1 Tax=Microbulbifer sp. ZKSA006 TaxID=3243390 RepID=UPI00403A44B7
MSKQFLPERLFWVLPIIGTFLLAISSQLLAHSSPGGDLTSVDARRPINGLRQDVVILPVLYPGGVTAGGDREAQVAPIRHFEGATAENFQEKIAHKKYHQICDRQPPEGLPPCEEASWKYRQAQACLQAREAWEKRWGRPETRAPHARALKNVRARLKNARANRARSCGI